MPEDELPSAAKRFKKHKLGLSVHSILWNEWDPIGVNGDPSQYVEIDPKTGETIGPAPEGFMEDWPDDEYDSYTWGVLSLLNRGADAQAIGEYLDQTTTHTIGVPWKDTEAMSRHHRALADKLVALRL